MTDDKKADIARYYKKEGKKSFIKRWFDKTFRRKVLKKKLTEEQIALVEELPYCDDEQYRQTLKNLKDLSDIQHENEKSDKVAQGIWAGGICMVVATIIVTICEKVLGIFMTGNAKSFIRK